tara:strand:+ start:16 stop:408 length:393 start_codon:yes stop_codon:yes gene_type:complete
LKIAYVFNSPHASAYKLGQMILPQLEADTHVVTVVGMFFFDDNTYVLRKGDPIGERLSKIAAEKNILLMMCDMCALFRNLAQGTPKWSAPDVSDSDRCVPLDVVDGVGVGCFPDLYSALSGNMPDHVITL